MKRDEAIQELKSEIEWSKLNKYPYIGQRKVKAINMAIKALEQEPYEIIKEMPSKYAISIEAVLDCIDKYSKMIIRPNEFKEYILALPPVIPQPKIGKPIYDETYHTYQCSNCRKIIGKTINFCPNCGAEMQEVEE